MGLPKIPDSKEIAGMIEESMKPMRDDIAAIKVAIERLVVLKEIEMGTLSIVHKLA
jgi:hypothetical protein